MNKLTTALLLFAMTLIIVGQCITEKRNQARNEELLAAIQTLPKRAKLYKPNARQVYKTQYYEELVRKAIYKATDAENSPGIFSIEEQKAFHDDLLVGWGKEYHTWSEQYPLSLEVRWPTQESHDPHIVLEIGTDYYLYMRPKDVAKYIGETVPEKFLKTEREHIEEGRE